MGFFSCLSRLGVKPSEESPLLDFIKDLQFRQARVGGTNSEGSVLLAQV